jgi:hypothetical protein
MHAGDMMAGNLACANQGTFVLIVRQHASNVALAMQRDNWEQSLDDLITFVGHISTVQVAVCVQYDTNVHCFLTEWHTARQ